MLLSPLYHKCLAVVMERWPSFCDMRMGSPALAAASFVLTAGALFCLCGCVHVCEQLVSSVVSFFATVLVVQLPLCMHYNAVWEGKQSSNTLVPEAFSA
jgi:hypothetical protein